MSCVKLHGIQNPPIENLVAKPETPNPALGNVDLFKGSFSPCRPVLLLSAFCLGLLGRSLTACQLLEDHATATLPAEA